MEIIIFIAIALFLIKLVFAFKGRQRKRRPPFKKMYELDQIQTIREFERKLTKGMFQVRKEVFVTAFVNDTHVLNVTATIGSKNKCGASDNVNLWARKAKMLGATRIRQYHNHPDVFGRSFPSSSDKKGHRELRAYVKQWGVEYQSLLVYKSWLGFAKIKEYH